MEHKKQSVERLNICKKCDFFTFVGTCGRPIIGETITTPQGYKVDLCGCVMRAKVLLADAVCPLNKW